MKTNIIKVFGLGLIASMTITSCSDDFLEEKKNYDNVNTGIYDIRRCIRRLQLVSAYGEQRPHMAISFYRKQRHSGKVD